MFNTKDLSPQQPCKGDTPPRLRTSPTPLCPSPKCLHTNQKHATASPRISCLASPRYLTAPANKLIASRPRPTPDLTNSDCPHNRIPPNAPAGSHDTQGCEDQPGSQGNNKDAADASGGVYAHLDSELVDASASWGTADTETDEDASTARGSPTASQGADSLRDRRLHTPIVAPRPAVGSAPHAPSPKARRLTASPDLRSSDAAETLPEALTEFAWTGRGSARGLTHLTAAVTSSESAWVGRGSARGHDPPHCRCDFLCFACRASSQEA